VTVADDERGRILAKLLLATERRYRRLAEALPQIVWTADLDGHLTYVNRRWSAYTGLPPEDALADPLGVIHPDDADRYTQLWRVALADRTQLEVECRLRRYDGELRWHLCRAVPELDDAGAVVGWLGTYTDVDDRRRALDSAQASLQARDEFLSIASHELRTPLTTLNLRLESLLEDSRALDDPRVRSRLESARRQSDRLRGLVDNMLDVVRITSGRLKLQRETFDLRDVAGELIDRFTEVAEVAGCKLELAADPAVGSWDRIRVDQALQNLVGNAIKYAPKTTIEISIACDETSACMAVRDHGPGIAPTDTERIFAQFERAVSMRHHGGLGMGLYIARQIALAHGGKLLVDSTPGEGAVFTIELPLADSPALP
jgi:PAS domain S-box-containing protein